MVYKFRNGYSLPVDAQTVGDRLTSIKDQLGRVYTPADVVADAKPWASPLHPCFEWNNRKAADLWREDQARHVIRSVETVETSDDGTETRRPAFVSVCDRSQPRNESAYMAIADVLDDDTLRRRVLNDVTSQLRGLARRLNQIGGPEETIEALEAIIVSIAAIS